MTDDEHNLELIMPFVVVQSVNGPWDDDAYAAGWEMGALDIRLRMASEADAVIHAVTIRDWNLPQLELVAMKHGVLVGEVLDRDTTGWLIVELRWL
jgi:hypothetical protein